MDRMSSFGSPSQRGPTVISGHTWKPEEIRSNPNAAFDLFDANKDGVISVAELLFTTRKSNESMRKHGNLFDEMKLFQMLDVDGDSVISREEWCDVITNGNVFGEGALAAVALLATRREKMLGERYLLIELFTVGGSVATKREWYDLFSYQTATNYLLIVVGNDNGGRVELASLRSGSSSACIDAKHLEAIDYRLRAELYDPRTKRRIGQTRLFDVARDEEAKEVALGPLSVFDSTNTIMKEKLLGTIQWVDQQQRRVSDHAVWSPLRRTQKKSSSLVAADSPGFCSCSGLLDKYTCDFSSSICSAPSRQLFVE